jgi:hypothetical protein
MARSRRLSRRWCAIHQAYYATWVDKQKTKLARCPDCADEDVRFAAAHQRSAGKTPIIPTGDV